MAYRASKSGINADQKSKLDATYDKEAEDRAREWVESVSGEAIGGTDFYDGLRDGSHFCKLLNRLQPGLVPAKFEKPASQPFKQLEAIGVFLTSCRKYGMSEKDLFVALDLHEQCNKNMVLATVYALGRTALKNGYTLHRLGPKEAEGQKREWTEEQLREGQNVIGLQMGTNRGASQQGMTPYGKGRQIYQS